MRPHFRATFGNLPILDALLLSSSKSKGEAAGLRQWELEVIVNMGWRESAWVRLPIQERYRKLCAYKLKDWMSALESEEQMKKLKNKAGHN